MGRVTARWIGVLAAVLSGAAVPRAAAQELTDPPVTHPAFPNFHLGVFGNIDFVASPAEDETSGFRNGALDLFATSQLSDRWSGLIELLFSNTSGGLVTSLERIQIAYDHSDALRLSAGRLHNPLVHWNVVHHHGVFLQTPITKPAMTEGESARGLWPVHFVGAMVTGRFANLLGVTYTLGAGNGRGATLGEIQVGADRNEHKALIAGIGISPAGAVGLELSVTGYWDRVPAPDGEIRERDITVSGSYVARGYELRSEWGRLEHEIAGGDDFQTTGWYVLLARRLPGALENIRPYVLLDRLEAAGGLAFLEDAPDQSSFAAGARWDVDPAVALKADVRSQRIGGGAREALVRLQLAFALN
ncbi:MAG: hypothetical protein ACRELX_06335 [Longimicrobiales bacterium]